MNKKDSVNKLENMMVEMYGKIYSTKEKIRAIENDIANNRNKYTDRGIYQLGYEVIRLKKEIHELQQEMKRATKKEIAGLKEDISGLYNLDPAELNDDFKLLTSSLPLTESELIDICKRNSGNKTMYNYIKKYAETQNFSTDTMVQLALNKGFKSYDEECKHLDGVEFAINKLIDFSENVKGDENGNVKISPYHSAIFDSIRNDE